MSEWIYCDGCSFRCQATECDCVCHTGEYQSGAKNERKKLAIAEEKYNQLIKSLQHKNEKIEKRFVGKILILKRELAETRASNLGMKAELKSKRDGK
jgi:hypothetical protein